MIPVRHIRKIELGPRQMTFGFEDGLSRHMDEAYNAVQLECESQGSAAMDGLMESCENMSGLGEIQLLQSLFWLAEESRIHFRIEDTPVSPAQTKQILLDRPETCVLIFVNRQADEGLFKEAGKIGAAILPEDPADMDQYEFSRAMLALFDKWQSRLESYAEKAENDNFPGKKDISAGLGFLEKLMLRKDSYSVIQNCYKYGTRITSTAEKIDVLTQFYSRDAAFWQELLDRMAQFKANMPQIKTNEAVYPQYRRLEEIIRLKSPYPYLEEARSAFESVLACHREIEQKKLDVSRKMAVAGVDKMVNKLIGLFDTFEIDTEYRNEMLIDLRGLIKEIETSRSIAHIERLQADAKDLFVEVIEEI